MSQNKSIIFPVKYSSSSQWLNFNSISANQSANIQLGLLSVLRCPLVSEFYLRISLSVSLPLYPLASLFWPRLLSTSITANVSFYTVLYAGWPCEVSYSSKMLICWCHVRLPLVCPTTLAQSLATCLCFLLSSHLVFGFYLKDSLPLSCQVYSFSCSRILFKWLFLLKKIITSPNPPQTTIVALAMIPLIFLTFIISVCLIACHLS